jgi:hypothetical protein
MILSEGAFVLKMHLHSAVIKRKVGGDHVQTPAASVPCRQQVHFQVLQEEEERGRECANDYSHHTTQTTRAHTGTLGRGPKRFGSMSFEQHEYNW